MTRFCMKKTIAGVKTQVAMGFYARLLVNHVEEPHALKGGEFFQKYSL